MTVGSRREARERAISLLYETDIKGAKVEEVLDDLPVAPDSFVVELVRGVGSRRDEIDSLIERFAQDWTIERMPFLDRAILRLATYELLARPEIPTGAAISEAVELAKQYSTDESSGYVNGVLASVALECRRPEA